MLTNLYRVEIDAVFVREIIEAVERGGGGETALLEAEYQIDPLMQLA